MIETFETEFHNGNELRNIISITF